jgi:2-iminoacetate synthase ThiH
MARVYSSTKPFYFADRLASLRDGAPAAPVHVRIKPTNVCNHDCYFCAYRCVTGSRGRRCARSSTT